MHRGGKENCCVWYCRCISESSPSSLRWPAAESQHFQKCCSYLTASHLQLLLTYTSRSRNTIQHTHMDNSQLTSCYVTRFIMYEPLTIEIGQGNKGLYEQLFWMAAIGPILVLTSKMAAGNPFILTAWMLNRLFLCSSFIMLIKIDRQNLLEGFFLFSLKAEPAYMFLKCYKLNNGCSSGDLIQPGVQNRAAPIWLRNPWIYGFVTFCRWTADQN